MNILSPAPPGGNGHPLRVLSPRRAGLAICRELARGMGGNLSAGSEPGRGSTFSLTLPAAAGA